MKKLILLMGFAIFTLVASQRLAAQCTPADSTTCPDPEGNGAVCPDTLKTAYLNRAYEQVVTMLIPSTYDTGIYSIPLHHVQLKDVGGLPNGIRWESNADKNNFMAGEYYCVLFSGTPTQTGHYVLKIIVDVYSSYNDVPIYVGQTIDSTSIWIDVLDANAVRQHSAAFFGFKTWPNPFRTNFQLEFTDVMAGNIEIDIYNLLGQLLYHQKYKSVVGKNRISVPGLNFAPQTMIIRLKQGNQVYSRIINKTP